MPLKHALFATLLLLPSLASAVPRIEDGGSGGRKIYQRAAMACLVSNDFYIVHFTAFQEALVIPRGRGGFQETPAKDRRGNDGPFAKHCQDVPNTGKTYLTADLLDRDVRNIPIALRVVEEQATPGQPVKILRTLAQTPPQVYRNGVAEIQADIDHAGSYALILDVGDGALSEDDHLRVPFNAGLLPAATESKTGYWVTLLVVALALLSTLTYVKRRRGRALALSPELLGNG